MNPLLGDPNFGNPLLDELPPELMIPENPYGGGYGPGNQYPGPPDPFGGLDFSDTTTVTGDDGIPGLTPGGTNPAQSGIPEGGDGNPVWEWIKKAASGATSTPGRSLATGAGLTAVGALLQALLAKDLFQKREGFTGTAAPQGMMEKFVGGMENTLPLLQGRASGAIPGFDSLSAQTPLGLSGVDSGLDDEGEQVRSILARLR